MVREVDMLTRALELVLNDLRVLLVEHRTVTVIPLRKAFPDRVPAGQRRPTEELRDRRCCP